MKKIKILLSLVLCLVICLSAITLSSCGNKGRALMSIDGKSISVNEYALLLSRMKGTLYYYGYDVESEDFWKTVISIDGLTYDDYFSTVILEEAYKYLIGDYLFSLESLELGSDKTDEIDTIMSALIKSAGSKSSLNSKLKDFCVNCDMLREIYVKEAKIEVLKDYYYGENGEKISDGIKDAYYRENYVAYAQILLPKYFYVTELDSFGDTVYYTDEDKTEIAYDTENGKVQIDEFGKTVKDKFGNSVYFADSGRISYDKQNGTVGYVYDKDGELLIEFFPDEEIGALYEKAYNYANDCNGDVDLFKEYAELYSGAENTDEIIYLVNENGYYASMGEDYSYLDDTAEALNGMSVGDCLVIESEFGYHVICKYQHGDKAYENEEYKYVFVDFYSKLIDFLFDEKCAEYEAYVVLDTDALEGASKMSTVGINTIY